MEEANARLVAQPSPLPTRKVVAATLGALIGAALGHWADLLAAASPWLAWLDSEPARLAAPVLGAALAGYCLREPARPWPRGRAAARHSSSATGDSPCAD